MKTFPIQFVKTRDEQDRFLKEGMGNNKLPKWATKETVANNIAKMKQTFQAVEKRFRAQANNNLPIIMVASLNENATKRKSFRANVRAVFDIREKRNVLGKESHKGLLVKVDNIEDLKRINDRVSQFGQENISQDRICGIAVVDNLTQFQPYIEEDINGGALKVRLVDYHDEYLNELSEKLIIKYGSEKGISLRRLTYTNELRLFAIDDATPDVISELATMDSVISVKKMPYFELNFSPEPYNTTIEVRSPQKEETYPRVGLLDTGVGAIPHLQPWLEGNNQNIANFEEEDLNLMHGTSVASIINYGDVLQGKELTGTSPSMITSCVVNTNVNHIRVYEDEMIEHIKESISQNPHIKVWNLSQGSSIEICDDSFSDFAITLDRIQRERKILICKSCGNILDFTSQKMRIRQGADSLMSLVVGSLTHEPSQEGDLTEGLRSPFSCIGFAPAGITKPDLVHFGGNAATGIFAFSEFGYQTDYFKGTSYSTPRVTALAANLGFRLGKFDPLLIRALLIHSATYINVDDYTNESLRQELGFGKPAILDEILYNDSNEFTMILSPDFNGQDYQIQDIPFPEELIDEDGFFEGEIILTIVTQPIFKSGEGSEYCQSDVDVLLQTYDKISYVIPGAAGVPSTYKNSDRLVNPENVLTKTRYSKPSFRNRDLSKRTIIHSEDYHPVKKYHINLSQMTPAQKEKCLNGKRHWGMSIKASYRDATKADKESGKNIGEVEAVIILTIKDPQKRGITYESCRTQLANRNFVHNSIEMQQRVQIENN